MANPLYESLGNQNPYAHMVNKIKEFSRTIQGNPQQMVQELLNSGKMTQAQFNQYSQMAQQILPFLK